MSLNFAKNVEINNLGLLFENVPADYIGWLLAANCYENLIGCARMLLNSPVHRIIP